MIILIDNYDSFTYNLFQQIQGFGPKVKVFKNDKINIKQIEKLNPSKIIISPGPGRPENSGVSIKIIQKFYKTKPILGVCLGHQCIGQIFGSEITKSKKIVHGKTTKIYHNNNNIFSKLKNPFDGARYNSLAIKTVPKDFTLTAWDKNQEIMAINHNTYPLFGIQFHPESFMTKEGDKLMKNFLCEKNIY